MSFAVWFGGSIQIPPSRNYATRDKVCKLCMVMAGSGREAGGCGRVSFAACFGISSKIPPIRNYATRDKDCKLCMVMEGSGREAGGCRLRSVSRGLARSLPSETMQHATKTANSAWC